MEPGGPLDMQQLFAAAAQVQSQLMNAQQRLAETEIEGSAGGGLVKVTISGQGELVDLSIAKEAIDPGDPAETASTIADLVIAACRDAYQALADVQAELMGPLAGGLGGGAGMPGAGSGAGPGGTGPAGIPGLPGFPGFPGQPLPGTVLPGEPQSPDKPSAPGED
jgi:DNA-binding YbaB/EbfC family protein